MPTVSIGMPVFNDVQFLRSALDSLLAQTYKDFELIISDDCSLDGSEIICREYEKSDHRVRYIRQNKNLGISRNMMFLLRTAKSKFFMWAGNDDMWHKNFLSALLNDFEKNKDCIVAFCPYVDINEFNEPITDLIRINYSAFRVKDRLSALIKKQNDAFGYGLFVKEKIMDVKFPVWFWLNKKCAYDNIFPTLCYYLAKGNYCMVQSDVPLWYNRKKQRNNVNHKIPFSNSIVLGFFAFALRKLNLVWSSAISIYRANHNLKLLITIFPRLFFSWFIIPVFYKIHKKYRAYKKEGPEIFI